MSPLFLVAPLLLLLGGGLLIMLLDAFAKERAELALVTSVTLLASAGVAAAALVKGIPAAGAPEIVTRYLAVDGVALFFDIVICAGGALSALLAGGYLREHGMERGEFYLLILFSAFGGMVLARAIDLLTLFVGLETLSLGVYAMVAYRRTSARAVEGAMKYFLLGSFAAALLLLGSAFAYGATGHTDFVGIGEAVRAGQADPALTLMALLLVIVGLAFKVSAVPFHMWTPDAYEGAVTPATTFMSVAVKAAAFAVLVRFLVAGFGDPASADPVTGWPALCVGLAVLTMVVGNVSAVVQSSVKRMLAYSSIAHAGYVLVGVAAIPAVGEEAIGAVLYYLLAYTVSNALAFGSLILLGSYGREAVSYEDLAGAGRRYPLAALPFVLGVLSLMGFPPTAGFFGKYAVFYAAVDAGYVWLAVVGVLTSLVGAYYYLRVLVFLFMRSPAEGAPIAVPMRSGYVSFALVLAGYYVMKMGVTPARFIDLAREAGAGLLG